MGDKSSQNYPAHTRTRQVGSYVRSPYLYVRSLLLATDECCLRLQLTTSRLTPLLVSLSLSFLLVSLFANTTTTRYIYEEFLTTQGVDVKVYTVGGDYAHAEARKAPTLDGRVQRHADTGKEVRATYLPN